MLAEKKFSVPSSVESTILTLLCFSSPTWIKNDETNGLMIKKPISEEPVARLHRLNDWVKKQGFQRATVTNAPRSNAEQMIAAVGLTDFFEYLVIKNIWGAFQWPNLKIKKKLTWR